MSEAEESRAVTIPEERLSRVTDAIALASAEAFDEAIEHLGGEIPDELGMVEEALRLFLAELRDAKQKSQVSMSALTDANQELERRLATIAHQERAIRELSAPILELWEGVVSLPVIGTLDAARAADMTERLLRRLVDARARWVLLDLTGVSDIDAATADRLYSLTSAVRLIGCRCVLTGIQPHVAVLLVEMRIELGGLHAARSLREGLRHCLKERNGGHQ